MRAGSLNPFHLVPPGPLRLAAFARSVLEANLRDPALPYRLFFQLTDACNCRCQTCAIWQRSPSLELTTDEVQRVLEKAGRFIRWMDLTGGEIFLRPDILQVLGFVARMPWLYMFHFATNGSLPDRILEGAALIHRSPIPRFIVTVSLDGPSEVHDRLRGVPGSFQRCLETFTRLRRLGVETVLGMTLSEHNHGLYAQTVAAVRQTLPQVTHRDFHVNLAQVSTLFYGNQGKLEPDLPRLLQAVEALVPLRGHHLSPVEWLERAYLTQARRFLQTGRTPLPCEALSSSAMLSPRGEIFPCIMFDAQVGSLREHQFDLAQLWRTTRRQSLRATVQAEQCPHCWTPCEAYQTIMANTLPLGKNRRGQRSPARHVSSDKG